MHQIYWGPGPKKRFGEHCEQVFKKGQIFNFQRVEYVGIIFGLVILCK